MAFTDEELRDFEDAFGISSEEPEESETEEETEETETTEDQDDTEESEDSESEEETEEEEEQPEEPKPAAKKGNKQNHAFAELRNQNKKQNTVLREIGKLLGLSSDVSIDEISDKVAEALIAKESKDKGIPVETLQEIRELRNIAEENKQIKLEREVTEAFTDLVEKYNLSQEQLLEFTDYLAENNMNPLTGELDTKYIGPVYQQLHSEDLIKAAVDKALAADKERREKAKSKSASGVPAKKGDVDTGKAGDYEIDSINALDSFLAKQGS